MPKASKPFQKPQHEETATASFQNSISGCFRCGEAFLTLEQSLLAFHGFPTACKLAVAALCLFLEVLEGCRTSPNDITCVKSAEQTVSRESFWWQRVPTKCAWGLLLPHSLHDFPHPALRKVLPHGVHGSWDTIARHRCTSMQVCTKGRADDALAPCNYFCATAST